MATFTGTVSAEGDNGYIGNGAFTTGSHLIFGRLNSSDYNSWARWTNVTIPQGATINTVTVTFQANDTISTDVSNFNIYFDNEDNATAPTTLTDYNSRAVTSAVAWNSVPHIVAGTDYTLPDLASILQTVINRAGWASGQSLQLLIKNNFSDVAVTRTAKDYTTDNANAFRISVDYTAAGGGVTELVDGSGFVHQLKLS